MEPWFQRHSPHFKSFSVAGVWIEPEFPSLWCLFTMIQLAYIVLTTLSYLHFVSMKFKAIVFIFLSIFVMFSKPSVLINPALWGRKLLSLDLQI